MGNFNTQWRNFGLLENDTDLESYFDARKNFSGSKNFYHYTSLENINNILGSESIWLSSVEKFNDGIDKKQFGENEQDRKKYYSICFSSGNNENLSLWYLYSGMSGEGGRLHITANNFKKMIENATFDIYECFDRELNIEPKLQIKDIKNGSDMTLEYGDILYFRDGDDNKKASLKYNTMTNYLIPQRDLFKYKSEHKGFVKTLIWYYEKETRILVTLTDKTMKRLDEIESGVEGMDSSKKKYFLSMNFKSIKDKIKVGLAPEIKSFEIITPDRYPYLYEHMFNTSSISMSDYKGEIEMKLCDKCEHKAKCDKCQHKKENKK